METLIKNSAFYLAEKNKKSIIVDIIKDAFAQDPYMTWLLAKSSNKNKLEIIINYVVEETFAKGQIYITNNNMGVALWLTEKNEKVKFELIKRNIKVLFKLGGRTIYRILKAVKISHSHFPKHKPYYYLYLIGVLPQGQGKGLSSTLINPLLDYCKSKKLPIYLETANNKNVEIYKKKGFEITDRHSSRGITITFMKIEN